LAFGHERIVGLNDDKYIGIVDLDDKSKFKQKYGFETKYSSGPYIRLFGSWTKFIDEIGILMPKRFNRHNETNADILKLYFEDEKEHGFKRATDALYRDGKREFHYVNIIRRFKSQDRFYELVGRKNERECTHCNKTFQGDFKGNRRYCSKSCQIKHWRSVETSEHKKSRLTSLGESRRRTFESMSP
jgi:hypothetical protein